MGSLKVGAFLSSFDMDLKSSLAMAQNLGLVGIQLSGIEGEIDVADVSEKRADELVRLFGEHGLTISAVCGEVGGFAIEDEDEAAKRVEHTKRTMETAGKLGCNIVQMHIGVIPHDMNGTTVANLRKSLESVGEFGKEVGVLLATETGPEPGFVMKKFLDTLQNPVIKVNYDPANLVMNGFDEVAGVYDLKDYIVHTHAKDGLRSSDEQEKPLGSGDVDFPRYIQALKEIGYDGYFIIEREMGEDRAKDISEAIEFLRQF